MSVKHDGGMIGELEVVGIMAWFYGGGSAQWRNVITSLAATARMKISMCTIIS